MRIASLAIVLFAFWLALSGHYTPLLLGIGVLSTALCVYVAERMRIVDDEGHPIELGLRTPLYYPWLFLEIIKSAFAVARIIVHPKLPISPTMTVVRASQKTQAGVATYANSITLTPGTITTAEDDGVLTVHALTRASALDLEAGDMDARVARFEGDA